MMLFCKAVKDGEDIPNILINTCKRFGLTILLNWTKIEVFYNEDLTRQETLFTIGSEKIDNVRSFTNIGQVITND